jgi:hypothetical protein
MKNNSFTLNKLSSQFYSVYSAEIYPEIENKPDRPYMVLIVKIDGNTFALPFRTNIRHSYCYKFANSGRDTKSVTGIDFTKAVVVNKCEYIGKAATIDNKEYVELSNKYFFIIKKFTTYLNGYLNYIKNGGNEYTAQKYKYCTLKYFHKELGI